MAAVCGGEEDCDPVWPPCIGGMGLRLGGFYIIITGESGSIPVWVILEKKGRRGEGRYG